MIYVKNKTKVDLIFGNGLVALLSLLGSKRTVVGATATDGITSPTSNLGKDISLVGACQINLTWTLIDDVMTLIDDVHLGLRTR